MNTVLDRIKNNYTRIGSLTVILLLGIFAIIVWQLRSTQNVGTDEQPTPTPLTTTSNDIGYFNESTLVTPSSYVFQDPIKAPETMTVYGILPGPDQLFDSDGIIAIATRLGFSSAAEVSPTQNGGKL